jgi:hypothetical protein
VDTIFSKEQYAYILDAKVNPEDGNRVVLRKASLNVKDYMVSKQRRK